MKNKYLNKILELNTEMKSWKEEDWDDFLTDAFIDSSSEDYAELENFILESEDLIDQKGDLGE